MKGDEMSAGILIPNSVLQNLDEAVADVRKAKEKMVGSYFSASRNPTTDAEHQEAYTKAQMALSEVAEEIVDLVKQASVAAVAPSEKGYVTVAVNLPLDLQLELQALAFRQGKTFTQVLREAMSLHLFIRREVREGSRILVEDRLGGSLREVVFSSSSRVKQPHHGRARRLLGR